MRIRFSAVLKTLVALVPLIGSMRQIAAQVIVPGTGKRVAEVGDDFEDPKWNYIANLPKSSQENDGQTRLPGGSRPTAVGSSRRCAGARRRPACRDAARRHPRQQGIDAHEDAFLRRPRPTELQAPARRFCGECRIENRHDLSLPFAERRDPRLSATIRAMGEAHGQFVRLPRRCAHDRHEIERPILQQFDAQVGDLLARHVHLVQQQGRRSAQGRLGSVPDPRRRNGARRLGTGDQADRLVDARACRSAPTARCIISSSRVSKT